MICDFHVWGYLHFLDYNIYYFIRTEDFVYNYGRKKQQSTISTLFKKVPTKKGELLLSLPHSVNFNVKINPCGNHFRKHIFFGKLSRGIFSSPFQNLFILCEENEVKFRRGELTKFWLANIIYHMWHVASWWNLFLHVILQISSSIRNWNGNFFNHYTW